MSSARKVGVVSQRSMQKTLRVEVLNVTRHSKYGKIVRYRTLCYAHDASSSAKAGDIVEIEESRPMSKLKRWRLVRIIGGGHK